MPVQEFECQIARSQIGRYLNGEGLSSEGLRHLGVHVAECSECKGFLDHRKAALQGMLGETPLPPQEEVRAVVDLKPAEALLAQLKAKAVEAEPVATAPVAEAVATALKPTKPLITKPLMYCGGLAIVLIGMTYISRNPTSLLGPKAASQLVADNSSKPATPAVTEKPAAAEKTDATPKVDATKPVEAAKTEAPKPDPVKSAPVETKPADNGKIQIAPDAKTNKAPLSVDDAADTEQSEATDTPVVAPKPHASFAKPKPISRSKPHAARWSRKGKWHRHSNSYLHLKAGSSAIHVYAN